jgi:hypothetical protein
MNVHATKLQAAENDLKQLMAEVSRAMAKAQEAIVRTACEVSPAGNDNRDSWPAAANVSAPQEQGK